MSGQCAGKLEWPELESKDGEFAKTVVEKENPEVKGVLKNIKEPPLTDHFCNRVVIWVDDARIVVRIPAVG
ncbi:Glu S.griseus protease inhibitor [Bienertia sinuspersici]